MGKTVKVAAAQLAPVFLDRAASLKKPCDAKIIAELGNDGNVARLKPGGGCSAILGPRGDYLAGPLADDEGLLQAELDFDRIVDLKMVVDSAGHYARPDVVRLQLDGRAQRPLVMEPGTP
jgi:predicted amidohydrolase